MEVREPPATYSEYVLLPEDGPRYEILGGVGRMTPAPGVGHQIISANIQLRLQQFFRQTRLGVVYDAPCDVILSETDVVQPDIFVVLRQRLSIVRSKGVFGAPDLVVEILSPSAPGVDLKHKLALYEKYRVGEYWIVDPQNRTVDLWTSVSAPLDTRHVFAGDGVAQSSCWPELQIPLAEVFDGLEDISPD